MHKRLLLVLLPARFFWADEQLTFSAKRLLVRLAACVGLLLLAAVAIGLLDGSNWREVSAGALFAWSVSGLLWAVTSYRRGSEETQRSLVHEAEQDLLHARLNQLAAQVGAPLLNLNEGGYQDAVTVRVQRHTHMSGLEEFRDYGHVHEDGDTFWDSLACGYPPD